MTKSQPNVLKRKYNYTQTNLFIFWKLKFLSDTINYNVNKTCKDRETADQHKMILQIKHKFAKGSKSQEPETYVKDVGLKSLIFT